MNPQHSPWQGDALPLSYSREMVGIAGLEPATPSSQNWCSSQTELYPVKSGSGCRSCIGGFRPRGYEPRQGTLPLYTRKLFWSRKPDLNRRRTAYETVLEPSPVHPASFLLYLYGAG